MISLINSWSQGLIIAVIISVIVEMILPDGNNKKYIKVVLSMYILFTIIYPLINKIYKHDISLNSMFKNTNKEIKEYETNTITLETNAYIEKTYKNKLETNIINDLKEKGYKVLKIKLFLEMEKEEEYGKIISAVISIDKLSNEEKEERASNVNKITINISSNENTTQNQSKITQEELDDINEFLENSYSIDKERIHINE